MTEVFTTSEKVFPPGTAVTRAPVHQTESYAIWPTALNVCTVVNGRLHNAVMSVLFVFWGRTIHDSKLVAEWTVQNNVNASILSFSYVYYFFYVLVKFVLPGLHVIKHVTMHQRQNVNISFSNSWNRTLTGRNRRQTFPK